MENVPNVASGANRPPFDAWRDFLQGKGYRNYLAFLNAKDYGIPQNRNRAFMVSLLSDLPYRFPQPVKLKKRLADYLEGDVPEEYFIAEDVVERYYPSSFCNVERERSKDDSGRRSRKL